MSVQSSRPMLAVLRETMRKLECSGGPETRDQTQLKRILQERIAEIESVQVQGKHFRKGK